MMVLLLLLGILSSSLHALKCRFHYGHTRVIAQILFILNKKLAFLQVNYMVTVSCYGSASSGFLYF